MITRKQIVDEARTWIGTPFQHQARVKGRGVDCIGVVQQVAQALSITKYDRSDYGREPANGELQKALNEHLIKIDTLENGCILLMKFINEPQHVAIYTDKNTIIHAYANVGKCVEHRLDPKWERRIYSMYKYIGVE